MRQNIETTPLIIHIIRGVSESMDKQPSKTDPGYQYTLDQIHMVGPFSRNDGTAQTEPAARRLKFFTF